MEVAAVTKVIRFGQILAVGNSTVNKEIKQIYVF